MLYDSRDSYFKNQATTPSPSSKEQKPEIFSKAELINLENSDTKANVVNTLGMPDQGFSFKVTKSRGTELIAGDARINVVVPKGKEQELAALVVKTQEYIDLGQPRYAAGVLLKGLEGIEGSGLKSKTIFGEIVEKSSNKTVKQSAVEELVAPKVNYDIDIKNAGVANNLSALLKQEGFSMTSGETIKIHAGKNVVELSVPAGDLKALNNAISSTQDHLDINAQKYAADFLIRELLKLDSVNVKSSTPLDLAKEVPYAKTASDNIASCLSAGKISVNVPKTLKSEEVHLDLSTDGKVVNSVVIKLDQNASKEERTALVLAAYKCIEQHEKTSAGVDSAESRKALAVALANLTEKFSYKGKPLTVAVVADKELPSQQDLKLTIPETINLALQNTAVHLLASKPETIETSVSKQGKAWSLVVETERTKLALDVDASLLTKTKDPQAALEKIAQTIKEKSASMLNTASNAIDLAAFIHKQLTQIPVTNLVPAAAIAHVAYNNIEASYDLKTGNRVSGVNQSAPTSSYKEWFNKTLTEAEKVAEVAKQAKTEVPTPVKVEEIPAAAISTTRTGQNLNETQVQEVLAEVMQSLQTEVPPAPKAPEFKFEPQRPSLDLPDMPVESRTPNKRAGWLSSLAAFGKRWIPFGNKSSSSEEGGQA